MHVLLSEEPMSEGNEIQAERLAMHADSLWNSLVKGEQRGHPSGGARGRVPIFYP